MQRASGVGSRTIPFRLQKRATVRGVWLGLPVPACQLVRGQGAIIQHQVPLLSRSRGALTWTHDHEVGRCNDLPFAAHHTTHGRI